MSVKIYTQCKHRDSQSVSPVRSAHLNMAQNSTRPASTEVEDNSHRWSPADRNILHSPDPHQAQPYLTSDKTSNCDLSVTSPGQKLMEEQGIQSQRNSSIQQEQPIQHHQKMSQTTARVQEKSITDHARSVLMVRRTSSFCRVDILFPASNAQTRSGIVLFAEERLRQPSRRTFHKSRRYWGEIDTFDGPSMVGSIQFMTHACFLLGYPISEDQYYDTFLEHIADTSQPKQETQGETDMEITTSFTETQGEPQIFDEQNSDMNILPRPKSLVCDVIRLLTDESPHDITITQMIVSCRENSNIQQIHVNYEREMEYFALKIEDHRSDFSFIRLRSICMEHMSPNILSLKEELMSEIQILDPYLLIATAAKIFMISGKEVLSVWGLSSGSYCQNAPCAIHSVLGHSGGRLTLYKAGLVEYAFARYTEVNYDISCYITCTKNAEIQEKLMNTMMEIAIKTRALENEHDSDKDCNSRSRSNNIKDKSYDDTLVSVVSSFPHHLLLAGHVPMMNYLAACAA